MLIAKIAQLNWFAELTVQFRIVHEHYRVLR